MDPYENPFKNEENNKDNSNDLNNPFAKEDNNEEFTNPFQAEFKNDNNKDSFNPYEDNKNNINPFEDNTSKLSKNNVNTFENDNSNFKKTVFNPYENNSTINNNKFDPYEDNSNDNPFEKNNENNPFENNFEDNINNNHNDNNSFNNNNDTGLPSFKNFEENSSNPYLNNKNNFNNMNSNYYNKGNNYKNNFGGPSDFNNNNPPNPFGNKNSKNNNNNNNSNPEDAKKIKAIMDTCISLFNQASNQYDNYSIREAIKTLCKSIKGFDGLKQTITNKKTSFNSLLPKITTLRNKAFSNLQEYRINIYQLINLKFKPVQYNQVDPLLEFCKRYILTEPFISFEDIFDPVPDQNKKLKFVMNEYFKKGQRMGYKNLLLYGPKGSGKTLAVHALAHDLKGKVAQIEGMELFKIPYFAKEYVKAAFTYMQFKPLIIYIKNMELMFSNMNNFKFIYDRASSSSLENIIFIASTTLPIYKLPKDISKMFHYNHCIRPADKSQKINFINFISEKIGIKINMNEQEINSFAFQNLGNYSNEDIFNLLVTAIELKKKQIGDNEDNQVYKEGLFEKDIVKALNSVEGSLTAEEIKNYYL